MRSHTVKKVTLLVSLALIVGMSSWSAASADEVRISPQDIAIHGIFQRRIRRVHGSHTPRIGCRLGGSRPRARRAPDA